MKLKDVTVRNAQPKAKPYKLSDGGGLYLEVMPNGSKYWRLKYRFSEKEKRLALGVYSDISLLEARERRDQARKLLANGVDPSAFKKETKIQNKLKAGKPLMNEIENLVQQHLYGNDSFS